MRDYSNYQEIGKTSNTVTYTIATDPDILIIVPLEGTIDNARDASENVAFIHNYALALGKPIGVVVIMTNMRSQDAEARRAYSEVDPRLSYGAGLVVESALSRALGSFFIGLSRPPVPVKLFTTIETSIDWLKARRPQ